jgi:hypothetical protein
MRDIKTILRDSPEGISQQRSGSGDTGFGPVARNVLQLGRICSSKYFALETCCSRSEIRMLYRAVKLSLSSAVRYLLRKFPLF